MKLGIVSDVHCRHEELRLVAHALLREGVDEILLAGDAHDEYRFSNEVVDVIEEPDGASCATKASSGPPANAPW